MTATLDPELEQHLARREEALARVRRLLITNLKVALPAEQIELDAPLFGTGLGLDSVDAVELVVAVETEFDLRLPEGAAGPAAFRTVHSLVEFVLDPPRFDPAPEPGTPEPGTPEPGAPVNAPRSESPVPNLALALPPELPPELRAIRMATALVRAPTTRAVRLRGEGARDAALWLLPSRLHLRDAQARQSLLLDASARPVADVVACADDEDYLLLVDGPGDPVEHMRANLRGDDVTLEDLSRDHDVIELHGPWAWELLAEVLGPDFLALPYLNFFRIDEGWCVRAGRTGEFGYHLIVDRGASAGLVARLLERGAEFDLAEVSAEALSLCGFENWFFDAWHVPEGATPIELQLQWRLAPDRDFLGRAAVETRRREATRQQVCVVSDGELVAGAPVALGSQTIGSITRAAYSHARGEHIASALVDHELATGGTDRFTAGDVAIRTVAPPLVNNRSLYVDPRRHAYRTRDEVPFGPLVRSGRAAMAAR